MQAIGYIRGSTTGQAIDDISRDAQEAKIRAWCDLNEYELAGVFTDAGVSGKREDNREGLHAAPTVIGDGDALVVCSPCRQAQSTLDTIHIADYLSKRNADVVSLS